MKVCSCGTELEFGIGPKGNRIPLEPVGHVYQLIGDRAVPISGLFRNHYTTCPRANEFRNRTAVREMVPAPADDSNLVHDLLEFVMERAPALETVQGWTKDQRGAAAEWAAREQTAEKGTLDRIPKPDFLEGT